MEHSDLSSATPGAADLFVMGKDIAESARMPEDKVIVLNNIVDMVELEDKLRKRFEK